MYFLICFLLLQFIPRQKLFELVYYMLATLKMGENRQIYTVFNVITPNLQLLHVVHSGTIVNLRIQRLQQTNGYKKWVIF